MVSALGGSSAHCNVLATAARCLASRLARSSEANPVRSWRPVPGCGYETGGAVAPIGLAAALHNSQSLLYGRQSPRAQGSRGLNPLAAESVVSATSSSLWPVHFSVGLRAAASANEIGAAETASSERHQPRHRRAELYPEVVDAREEEGGVPSRLIEDRSRRWPAGRHANGGCSQAPRRGGQRDAGHAR